MKSDELGGKANAADQKRVAEIITGLRKAAGHTQKSVIAATGFTGLPRWESSTGKEPQMPQEEHIFALAALYGADPGVILREVPYKLTLNTSAEVSLVLAFRRLSKQAQTRALRAFLADPLRPAGGSLDATKDSGAT